MTRTLVILVSSCILSLAGCKKDKKAEPGGGSAAAKAALPASDELRTALAMMPLDSEAIVGFDLAELRGTELYKTYEKDLRGQAASQLETIQKLCGFDPSEKLTSVVAAGKGNSRKGDATAVVRGLSKADTMGCLTKASKEKHEGVTITVDGDFAMIQAEVPDDEAEADGDGGVPLVADSPPDPSAAPKTAKATRGESASVQFLDDQTAVVARREGKAPDKAAMAAIVGAKPGEGVTSSAPFMEMIDGIDTDAPLWFVINGKAPAVQKLTRGLLRFDAAYGHVLVGSGLDIHATMRVDKDETAKSMSEMAQRQVDSMKKSLMKDMLGEVTVTQDGRDVHLRLQESREQLAKLIDFAGTFLSGLLN